MSEKLLTEKTSFEILKMALDYVGFESTIKPVDHKNRVEQLFVSLPNKENQEIMVVQMMFADDLFESGAEQDEDASILQFIIKLPIKLKEDKYWKMLRLINVFNGLLPIGAFSENQVDGIYYRYSLIMAERKADNALTVEILNMINYFVSRLGRKIIEFSDTDKTFDEIVKEAELSFS